MLKVTKKERGAFSLLFSSSIVDKEIYNYFSIKEQISLKGEL
jgi:hypothetical protein